LMFEALEPTGTVSTVPDVFRFTFPLLTSWEIGTAITCPSAEVTNANWLLIWIINSKYYIYCMKKSLSVKDSQESLFHMIWQ
jgi:hypothetical protein